MANLVEISIAKKRSEYDLSIICNRLVLFPLACLLDFTLSALGDQNSIKLKRTSWPILWFYSFIVMQSSLYNFEISITNSMATHDLETFLHHIFGMIIFSSFLIGFVIPVYFHILLWCVRWTP